MKKCSQCGANVSESSQVGDRCPKCGLTWQAERNQSYSVPAKSKKTGCFLSLIFLLIILVIPAFLLTYHEHRFGDDSYKISGLWLTLNTDSLSLSVQKINNLSPEKRDKTINKAALNYIDQINSTKGEDKIRTINFISRIDSGFKTNGFLFPSILTNKLIEIESDSDLLPQIRESAKNTLYKINNDTY